MIYNITPNTDERNDLITITKFFELFGTWLPSLVPVLVTLLPKINKSITMEGVYSGFAYFMLILAAVFAVFGFFNMRERVPLMSREEIKETSVLESLKNIITNRPLLAVILANFFNSFKSSEVHRNRTSGLTTPVHSLTKPFAACLQVFQTTLWFLLQLKW